MDFLKENPLVSVVMIFLNAEKYIQEAIQSVFSQDYSAWELLLVDDGSTDGSAGLARDYARQYPEKVRCLEHAGHQNRGMSASRNLGARYAHGRYLAFLDADDVWLPHALETAVSLLEAHPAAGMLYGTTEWWYSWTGLAEDQERDFRDSVAQKFQRPNSLAYPPELLRLFLSDGGAVPCPCSILVRRRVFEEVGGFDESFSNLFEDQAFYVKVGLHAIVYVTDACWSRYRQHPESSCSTAEREGGQEWARQTFLTWLKEYLERQGVPEQDVFSSGSRDDAQKIFLNQDARIAQLESGKAWLDEQWQAWKKIAEERGKTILDLKTWISQLEAGKAWLEEDRQRWRLLVEGRSKGLSGLVWRIAGFWPRAGRRSTLSDIHPTPENGALSFSRWPRQPVSREWGYDRGNPVDRYYIEKFLEKYAADVQGCVLEIGDNSYTVRFGEERVARSEVLHLTEGNPLATIVADLTHADHIPSNLFDCIILTQTLHLIYDLRAALNTLHRILKPGGVLLATFPGITRISATEWPGSWYWGLTSHSARRLFEETFPPPGVSVEACGNVLAASAFLYGFAVEELDLDVLEFRDPEYDLLVLVRAVKESLPSEGAVDVQKMHTIRKSPRRPVSLARYTLRKRRAAQALILLYHRVAPPVSDPWALCVSPERFAEHLQAIRDLGAPICLEELADGLAAGDLPQRAIAVTFDDGYADNLTHARPLLEKYRIPATIFVPTAALGQTREFWWDELERVFLQPGRLPPELKLEIEGKSFHWDLDEAVFYPEEAFEKNRFWHMWLPPPGPRQRVYLQVWERLHPLTEADRREVMDEILSWTGLSQEARLSHRTLGWNDVAGLASDRWIDFGSHGITHASLASLPVEAQAFELQQSKAALEAALGRRLTSLAYPYGQPQDFSERTASLAREAGYRLAVTSSKGGVPREADLFQLPRIHISDWPGDEFARRMMKWMRG